MSDTTKKEDVEAGGVEKQTKHISETDICEVVVKPTRNAKGQLLGGANPNGRPKKDRPKSGPYLQIMAEVVTADRWKAVVETAVLQAIEGDSDARKFLERTILPVGFEPVTSEKCDPIDWGNMTSRERAVALAAWINRYLADKKTLLEQVDPDQPPPEEGETIDVG